MSLTTQAEGFGVQEQIYSILYSRESFLLVEEGEKLQKQYSDLQTNCGLAKLYLDVPLTTAESSHLVQFFESLTEDYIIASNLQAYFNKLYTLVDE